jgi:hypothetical protein
MKAHWLRGVVVAACVVTATVSIRSAGPVPLRQDSDRLQLKIASIHRRGATPVGQRVSTMVTEREVNAYLALEAADELPVGFVDPSISILGGNRVTGRAIVDLDRVRQQRNPASLFDPVRYLSGRLVVQATGLLSARDGMARFELEAADMAGVPIPKLLLQQIVSHYSRTSARPSGISLDDPMVLPARIREIHVQRGQAVIVQ